jgi:hypothetical protein
MAVSDCFALDRNTAQRQFRAACRRAGVTITPYFGPQLDSRAPEPIIEVVRFGDPSADGVLALTGGSWEDEGLCASGIQTAILRARVGEQLPAGVGLILIHAIAPAGLSGLEPRARSSFDQPPRQWTQRALAAAENRFAKYIGKKGATADQAESKSPPWQAQLLCRIANTCFRNTKRIALLDLRTGPGNYGDAEIFVCGGRRESDVRRTAALFDAGNPGREPGAGGYPGELAYGLMTALERSDLAAAVLEFGTYSMRSILAAGPGRTFYPDSEDWRESVWRQSLEITRRTLNRLGNHYATPMPSNPS